MSKIKTEYLEKIYSGWLAKIIGIRLGAPIEGWTYDKIKETYGELWDYPVNYKDFAADDDSNGPLFFLRALENSKNGFDLSAQDVGEALLNYAPFEHGFFWWGGYGSSTEHTAYLNLRSGITAPRSGSIEQNGAAVAEQIGGQIFIDTWGLVTPGNPDLAAKYAEKAASVTHGGNGIYGGIFVATCISYAFIESDMKKIIEKGLSYIPADCEYTRAVRAVMDFYDANPKNWRDCYQYIFDNFGYDRYPGACHIIPNIAVMILSMLYGEGDFSDTINICNMCGWDTDCNVGNVATIMGVREGLSAIDYDKWRTPINDFVACSSVIGSLNIMDIPYGAAYIAKLAWAIAGEKLPAPWDTIIDQKIDSCHFEFPGSTHAIRGRTGNAEDKTVFEFSNSDENAFTGSRSLKVNVQDIQPDSRLHVYKKTYYRPADLHDSRYDPTFSPILYPGQTICGSVYLPKNSEPCHVSLYALDVSTNTVVEGEKVLLKQGEWASLSFKLPSMDSALIYEAGFLFDTDSTSLDCFIDDFYFGGTPDYSLDFSKLELENWRFLRTEVSQFIRLKGLLYLDGGTLNLSCADFAEAYTGHHDWNDYTASFTVEPVTGKRHFVNVRVQGAIRSYAAGFSENGLGLYKNDNGYTALAEIPFDWKYGKTYDISVSAKGNELSVFVDGKEYFTHTDTDFPYLTGFVGLSVHNGSHCRYHGLSVR
jgi:ADP-ribosylglycohydrolase